MDMADLLQKWGWVAPIIMFIGYSLSYDTEHKHIFAGVIACIGVVIVSTLSNGPSAESKLESDKMKQENEGLKRNLMQIYQMVQTNAQANAQQGGKTSDEAARSSLPPPMEVGRRPHAEAAAAPVEAAEGDAKPYL